MDTTCKFFGKVLDDGCNFVGGAMFLNDSVGNMLNLMLVTNQGQPSEPEQKISIDKHSVYGLECFILYQKCCKYITSFCFSFSNSYEAHSKTYKVHGDTPEGASYKITLKPTQDDHSNLEIEIDLTKVKLFSSEEKCITDNSKGDSCESECSNKLKKLLPTLEISISQARDYLKSHVFYSNLHIFEKLLLLIRRYDIMEKIPLLIQYPAILNNLHTLIQNSAIIEHNAFLIKENERLQSIMQQAAASMIDNKRKPSNIVKIANSLKQEIVVK